jgi:hypothetical protein
MEARHNPMLVAIIATLWGWGGGGGGPRAATAVAVETRNPILSSPLPSVNGPQGPFGPKGF